jgi:hypothetical protein
MLSQADECSGSTVIWNITDECCLPLTRFIYPSTESEFPRLQPLLEYYTDLSKISEAQFDTKFLLQYLVCDNQRQNSVKKHGSKAKENKEVHKTNNKGAGSTSTLCTTS